VNKRVNFVVALALVVLACSKPKPVEVTPRSVQVAAVLPQGLQLALTLDVRNPNGFAIRASDVKGTLSLQDGTVLGRGSASDTVTVLAEQTAAVPTNLNMSWTNLAALAPYALSSQPLPYRIQGSARIGGEQLNVEVPFEVTGQLTREQLLQAGIRGTGGVLPALPR
jgi:LEA14-like dessication related protein